MKPSVLTGMTALFLAACGGGDAPAPAPPEMTPDPAQVSSELAEVVSSTSVDRSRWIGSGDWTLEPISSFAAQMDDTVLVHTINALRTGPNGLLHLVMQRQGNITVLTPEGSFVRRIGQRGSGPGEFMGVNAHGWRNDSLWVVDADLARLSWFDLNGNFLGSVPREPRGARPTSTGGYMEVLGWSVENRSTSLVFQKADGALPLEVLPLAWTRSGFRLPAGENAAVLGSHPMGDRPVVAWDPLGRGLIVIELPASGGTVRLTQVSSRGELGRQRSVELPTRPLTAAEWRALLDARWGNSDISVDQVLAVVPRPTHWVPVTAAIAATDGRLLVRGPTFNTDIVTWTIISAEGVAIGGSLLPADLRVMYVSGDTVWAVRPNEDDLDVVTRFRLRRVGG